MALYGLLGYPLGHSFSKAWFESRGYPYQNFEYEYLADFLKFRPHDLCGFNVTIPHKQAIIPFLDSLNDAASEIGAVNCVTISGGKMRGYNTDCVGFEDSLKDMIKDAKPRAAVLGSGGASHAVCYVLKNMGIDFVVVSRSDNGYQKFKIEDFRLIINTSPVGMYPNVETAPDIDYDKIDSSYFLYDLVYNPAQTLFLARGRVRGARVVNGLAMLYGQAQAALRHFVNC